MNAVPVVLADGSPVVIAGFTQFFQADPRISVVAEAASLSQLQAALASRRGSIVILGWPLIEPDSHEVSDAVHSITASAKLICSGMPETLDERRRALRLGATGFINTHDSARTAIQAVLRVARGRMHIGSLTAEALLASEFARGGSAASQPGNLDRLTHRERQLIGMVCDGLRNKIIASELHIAEATVCHHLTSVYAKLKVSGRTGLVAFAFANGLHSSSRMQRVYLDSAASARPPQRSIQPPHPTAGERAGSSSPSLISSQQRSSPRSVRQLRLGAVASP